MKYENTPEALGIADKRACRFIDPALSTDGNKRLPFVEFDRNSADGLPCNKLLDGKAVIAGLGATPVSERGCLEQRKVGLCPRGFGLTVPENLKVRP